MRVVFDSNVLARAHQRALGPARRALVHVTSGTGTLILSSYILWKLERVLTYPRLLKRIILRDFINSTVGFTKLSDVTQRPAKSLMRMLGPRGNPQARNLFEIVAYLQKAEGVRFEVRSSRAALRRKKAGRARGIRGKVKSRGV